MACKHRKKENKFLTGLSIECRKKESLLALQKEHVPDWINFLTRIQKK